MNHIQQFFYGIPDTSTGTFLCIISGLLCSAVIGMAWYVGVGL